MKIVMSSDTMQYWRWLWHHDPEDHSLKLHHHQNLKSHCSRCVYTIITMHISHVMLKLFISHYHTKTFHMVSILLK